MNELELQKWRIERLRAAIDKVANGNKTEFGRRLGYRDGAFIRQLLSGDRAIREKTITSIETLPGMKGWFLDPDLAAAPGSESSPGLDTAFANVTPAALGQRKIPLISSVQAGKMAEAVEPFPPGGAYEYLLTDLELSEHAFGLEVEGRSMEPKFYEGDRLIVDPALHPRPGDFVIAKNGHEEATFKKYQLRGINAAGQEVFELVPLNPDYATINSEHEPVRIIGVVVEHRQVLRR